MDRDIDIPKEHQYYFNLFNATFVTHNYEHSGVRELLCESMIEKCDYINNMDDLLDYYVLWQYKYNEKRHKEKHNRESCIRELEKYIEDSKYKTMTT